MKNLLMAGFSELIPGELKVFVSAVQWETTTTTGLSGAKTRAIAYGSVDNNRAVQRRVSKLPR